MAIALWSKPFCGFIVEQLGGEPVAMIWPGTAREFKVTTEGIKVAVFITISDFIEALTDFQSMKDDS